MRPVFASVIQRRLPDGEALAAQAVALTETIARVCERPVANVHVIFQPSAVGRVAFGGVLVAPAPPCSHEDRDSRERTGEPNADD